MMGTPPFQTLAMLVEIASCVATMPVAFENASATCYKGSTPGILEALGLDGIRDVGDVAHDVADFHLDQMRYAGGLG